MADFHCVIIARRLDGELVVGARSAAELVTGQVCLAVKVQPQPGKVGLHPALGVTTDGRVAIVAVFNVVNVFWGEVVTVAG